MSTFRNRENRPRRAEGDRDEDRPSREVGRRERARREKLSRIRQAAWELFHQRGFGGATTRQIAEAADVGVGTLFLYAKDKRELLLLVYDGALAEISDEALDGLPEHGPLEGELLSVFGRLFGFYERDRDLSRLFVSEVLAGGEGEVRRRSLEGVGRFVGRLAERVELAQGRGEVALEVDPLRAARNLFALYYTELTAFLASDASAGEALEGPLREAIGLQVRGLLPRDAKEVRGHSEKGARA